MGSVITKSERHVKIYDSLDSGDSENSGFFSVYVSSSSFHVSY